MGTFVRALNIKMRENWKRKKEEKSQDLNPQSQEWKAGTLALQLSLPELMTNINEEKKGKSEEKEKKTAPGMIRT